MIGTFSGMGGAKKNSPKYAQLGYINMSALIQYFLTANPHPPPPPPPPSHIHHTISKICSDINKKGGFSKG